MPMEPRKVQSVAESVETPFRLRTEFMGGTYTDLIASWVQKRPEEPLQNLMQFFSVDNLRLAYREIPGSKAVGSDGITKEEYGRNLEDNLQDLHQRMRKMAYIPSDARLVLIPKFDGGTRPIAISNFEDKLVQKIAADILTAIYDRSFKGSSFGFRPKKSCHAAISYLFNKLRKSNHSYVVDVDLKSFFNSIDHKLLIEVIQQRITEKTFLRYLVRMLKAGILVEGISQKAEAGTPQGSIVSPVLANIFLHEVLDKWFEETIQPELGGELARYADDFVAVFSNKDKADEFMRRLEDRLNSYHLSLNREKTKVINFNRDDSKRETFDFLGFTFYWGKPIQGNTILKVKTRMQTFKKKIQEYKAWIQENRSHYKLSVLWKKTAQKLQGHYNYYGVLWNRAKLNHFYQSVTWILFRWLNRRGQKKSYTWEGFKMRLGSLPLPLPTATNKLINLANPRLYCA